MFENKNSENELPSLPEKEKIKNKLSYILINLN